MEYINIARNINEGRGLVQSIKFHLYDPAPVVTNALRSRPPLTSLILAGLLQINNNFYFLQAFNLTLGVFNALLIYYLTRSLIGGLLADSNPNILITGRMVLSDQLFATFILLAMIIWKWKENIWKYILLGATSALLALTRLEGMILIGSLTFVSLKKTKLSLIMLVSFVLIMLPYFELNWQQNGNPLYSKNAIHYQTHGVREALEGGFEKNLPPPGQFLRDNFIWVSQKVASATSLNFLSLVELGYLGPLIIILAFALKKSWRQHFLWLGICLFILMLYGSIWSATFERSRHFIFVYLVLLIPITEFLKKNRRPVFLIILALTFISYLFLDVHRIVWARNIDPTVSVWDQPTKQEIYSWVIKNTSQEDIIASTNPFMINLQTDRPSIALPSDVSSENFPRYIRKFQVKYLILLNDDRSDFHLASPSAIFSDGKIYLLKQ